MSFVIAFLHVSIFYAGSLRLNELVAETASDMRENGGFVQQRCGSGGDRSFKAEKMWRGMVKSPARSSALLAFSAVFFATAFVAITFFHRSTPTNSAFVTQITESSAEETNLAYKTVQNHINPHDPNTAAKKAPKIIEYPLICSGGNLTQACPTNYPTKLEVDPNSSQSPGCPDYFRWIHEDLRPWRETGVTRDMLERAKRTANFRLVIQNGKAYVQTFQKAFQTRDVFTLWGIVQLLRRYPGKVPDLELMFDCVDWPVIQAKFYRGPNATAPPPLFRYCKDDRTLDIVFPDWSFWGWPEVNIKPWEALSKELKEGHNRKKWMDREPYAYWKGNPAVAPTRMDLLKCNVSDKQDWQARIYAQDWIQESQQGYKQSDLSSQCMHRYKIYIEGSAWSVSEKYILACDSVTLVVKPQYFDFFSRSLMPVHHYWPIRDDDKCRSIKFAVDWGNNHKQKAQEIGKAASKFIQEDMKMDFVYDYMLHLLVEYAKLQKLKPTVPRDTTELCAETMACTAKGLEKTYMMESMVKGPSATSPCSMPPPYDPLVLRSLLRRKSNALRQVEKWERVYWDSQTH